MDRLFVTVFYEGFAVSPQYRLRAAVWQAAAGDNLEDWGNRHQAGHPEP